MNGVEREVKDRLIRVLKTLETHSALNRSIKTLVSRLNQCIEKFGKTGETIIYTRELVEKYIDVFEKTVEFEKIVERFLNGGAVLGDVYMSYERLEESLKEFMKIRSKVLFRERIAINIPIWVALVFYIFDYFSNVFTKTTPILIHFVYSIIVSLGLTSLIIATRRIVLSYVILLISTIIGLINSALIINALQSTSLYLMLVFVSIIYLNIARIQSSSEYRERVNELFRNVMDFIDRSKREVKSGGEVDEDKLWNEALNIFKSIYSDRAEELLRFKVETMVMNGLNKIDALKKIIETYRKITD